MNEFESHYLVPIISNITKLILILLYIQLLHFQQIKEIFFHLFNRNILLARSDLGTLEFK